MQMIICKEGKLDAEEVYGAKSNLLFLRKVRDQKHVIEVNKCKICYSLDIAYI